jgi:hypothetical protein
MGSNPQVFLSYSHDGPEHRKRVLALSERLRADGIDTRLDQYVNGTPAEGWPRWMLNQLDSANRCLLVCTPTYYRRFRGHEEVGSGRGVDWGGRRHHAGDLPHPQRRHPLCPRVLRSGRSGLSSRTGADPYRLLP